ncbi:MAG: cysteine--tRNA ligase [Pseudomonadota bacterium]
MLRIYNSLARDKQDFVPIRPGEVRMYVCGMTVYDHCHLGHARLFLAFDVIQRWLRASGYRVTYVCNITDIDDKIIKRAADNGETTTALTERFIRAMHEDFDALGIQRADHEPRATEYVPQMLDLIGLLEKNELAYQAQGADSSAGDVNFTVRKFPGYGKLSGKSIDDLRAGERVAIDLAKRDPLDFVLWKSAKPGEPKWSSPWGDGRPGWAIECSAMSCTLLGKHFDIHGGGPDLIFPHHENEIAQSEGGYGEKFVNVWMHCGALRVGEDKMSKSLANFLTIRDALKKHDAEVLRFFLIRSHYRSPIAFLEPMLGEARTALARLYTALRDTAPDGEPLDWNEAHAVRFKAAMDDDFNTAEAVAELHLLANEVFQGNGKAASQLKGLGGVIGLLQRDPQEFLQSERGNGPSKAEIREKIMARLAARKAKNYAEADRIRKELEAAGVILEDDALGTTWRWA